MFKYQIFLKLSLGKKKKSRDQYRLMIINCDHRLRILNCGIKSCGKLKNINHNGVCFFLGVNVNCFYRSREINLHLIV